MATQHLTLRTWLQTQLKTDQFELISLQGDASFRRYYRLVYDNQSLIAVDAPPATEDNPSFIRITQSLSELGLHTPKVLASDLDRGLLLLTDLGDDVFFYRVNENTADTLYKTALIELGKIQRCNIDLPQFDATFMGNELALFTQWVLEKHLRKTLSPATRKMLEQCYTSILVSAVEQPQCFIHRDYHSRNLMLLPNQKIGILDFRDAMVGPITYDLVSLIRDCYIDWPHDQVSSWAHFYYDNFVKGQIHSREQFIHWFDWMGVQRHLKASFIFARKHHRDDVNSYLKDIPRAMNYIMAVTSNYRELINFRDWLGENVVTQLETTQGHT